MTLIQKAGEIDRTLSVTRMTEYVRVMKDGSHGKNLRELKIRTEVITVFVDVHESWSARDWSMSLT